MADEQSEKPSGGLRPETLLSSLVVVLAVNVVQRSVGFGRAVLFCRWLDPEELGQWEMAYGFLILAAPLAVLGLPGSFARYLEKYRLQGRLQQFLRRTSLATSVLAAGVLAAMLWRRESLAKLVFGSAGEADLMVATIACLAIVILHHFLEAVFAGLRMYRVVSAMHFAQSLSFAAISLSLLAGWRNEAISLLVGYAGACLLSISGVVVWSLRRIDHRPDASGSVSQRDFWAPLMKFAIWVWVANLLSNVFTTVDRYMIVHFGGFEPDEALIQVGNYHTSIIVPVLLLSVANLLVGAMTPHLSHDWESGRREAVAARLNLGLKLATLGVMAAGVGVLLFCPRLFHYAFADKYDAGLAVLPWTLLACVWFSVQILAQQYVWFVERSHLAAIPLVFGLLANVGLNLVLLPRWGLSGAVIATAVATLVVLLVQLDINRRCGMKIHRGTWFVVFAPAVLVLGAEVASIACLGMLFLAVGRGWVLTPRERRQMLQLVADRGGPLLRRFRPAS